MQTNLNTTIERIIAKIDNDFNPDNSDWIPRVGAWCIDAMQILDVVPTQRVTKKVKVRDRIAYVGCRLDNTNIQVTDSNGCVVEEAGDADECCSSFTGSETKTDVACTTNTTEIVINKDARRNSNYVKADLVNSKDLVDRYNVVGYRTDRVNVNRNYVLVDCNKIELNFDTDYINISYNGIKTEYSKVYGCELPVIPNNGTLIEAIVYYCMYKMLTRNYKHPVFNLSANNGGVNPYLIWNQLKEEAKRSVINNSIDDKLDDDKLWRSSAFLATFGNSRN